MRRYYEDRRTGDIYSLTELAQLIEERKVARVQVPRRFRVVPEAVRRLLGQAELIAAAAEHDRDRHSA